MRTRLLIPLCFVASPLLAEPFSHQGYALGCDDAGCTIFAAGYLLHVANDGSTPARLIRKLARMDNLTAVNLKGDLGALGDATAPLTLTGLSLRAEDPYQDTLRAVQGVWRVAGDPVAFVTVSGLEWQVHIGGEGAASFLITPRDACADGTAPGGMVLSLYALGGDPAEASCLQVVSVSASAMTLRDPKGQKPDLVYQRDGK